MIILYTSTFIRLCDSYQEWHAHCIVVTNDGRDGIDGGGGVDLYEGVGGAQGVGIIL